MRLTYEDEFGVEKELSFVEDEYDNLMQLLSDKAGEDWGDCRGRAWCGTCHITLLRYSLKQNVEAEERAKLGELVTANSRSRLACQIRLQDDVAGLHFRIAPE